MLMPVLLCSQTRLYCYRSTLIDALKAVRKNTDIIPEIRDDLKAVCKTSDMALTEIKGLREDVQPGFAMQIQQIQADVRAIKKRLGMA